MAGASPQALEAMMLGDFGSIEQRFEDERFAADLYRAIAGERWFKDGHAEHLHLDHSRAEHLINAVRERIGRPALKLRELGGEGGVSDSAREVLGRLGWRQRPA